MVALRRAQLAAAVIRRRDLFKQETRVTKEGDTPHEAASFDLSAVRHDDGLARAAPSAQHVDADAIVAFLDAVEADGLDVHSVMLHRHGAVLAEAWRWPYAAWRPRILHSVAKSFTACAIGLALEDGLLRLDDRVVSFFPELVAAPADSRVAQLTVEHLLTMRVGHANETSGATSKPAGSPSSSRSRCKPRPAANSSTPARRATCCPRF
jgi:CubicO group peptidase (beta-lactamase class C family)